MAGLAAEATSAEENKPNGAPFCICANNSSVETLQRTSRCFVFVRYFCELAGRGNLQVGCSCNARFLPVLHFGSESACSVSDAEGATRVDR